MAGIQSALDAIIKSSTGESDFLAKLEEMMRFGGLAPTGEPAGMDGAGFGGGSIGDALAQQAKQQQQPKFNTNVGMQPSSTFDQPILNPEQDPEFLSLNKAPPSDPLAVQQEQLNAGGANSDILETLTNATQDRLGGAGGLTVPQQGQPQSFGGGFLQGATPGVAGALTNSANEGASVQELMSTLGITSQEELLKLLSQLTSGGLN